MKRYYLEKEKGYNSLSLPNEAKEKAEFLFGNSQDYYFGLRNLVLKCGFKIPKKFEKEQSLHEGTHCPVFCVTSGKRYFIAKIVFKEHKNGKHNGNERDRLENKEENKELIGSLTAVVNSSV